jgi:hypothetical protein
VQQVIAIVKPYLAEKVLDALQPTPVEACDVREVKVICVGVRWRSCRYTQVAAGIRPVGTLDNSPAVHCWVSGENGVS